MRKRKDKVRAEYLKRERRFSSNVYKGNVAQHLTYTNRGMVVEFDYGWHIATVLENESLCLTEIIKTAVFKFFICISLMCFDYMQPAFWTGQNWRRVTSLPSSGHRERQTLSSQGYLFHNCSYSSITLQKIWLA